MTSRDGNHANCIRKDVLTRFTKRPAISFSEKYPKTSLTNFCNGRHVLLMKDYVLVIETDTFGNLAEVTHLHPNSFLLLYLPVYKLTT